MQVPIHVRPPYSPNRPDTALLKLTPTGPSMPVLNKLSTDFDHAVKGFVLGPGNINHREPLTPTRVGIHMVMSRNSRA